MTVAVQTRGADATTPDQAAGPAAPGGPPSPSRPTGPAAAASEWASRPALAFALRALAYTAPILASVFAVYLASRAVPRPNTLGKDVAWWAGMLAAGTVALVVADRIARRLLPLAALFRLSLVFPDAAPPRFSVALRTGTVRNLQRDSTGATKTRTQSELATAELARLIGLLHQHDRMTRGHAERVRAYAQLIGQELGISGDDHNKLQWAALLHDIGKLEVPPEILNKPARLNDEEYAVIRGHPGAGGVLIEPLRWWLGDWAGAVAEHHERFDGQGYPRALTGTEITLAGRIVAVADAFDVMTATRSYKKPQDPALARAELTRCAGTHFDPVVVRAFLTMSLGRLRRAMGPLSWLANVPILGSVATAPLATTTISAVAATALGAGAVTLGPLHDPPFNRPTIDASVVLGEPASLSATRPAGPNGGGPQAPGVTSTAPPTTRATVPPSTVTVTVPPTTTAPATTAPSVPVSSPSTPVPTTSPPPPPPTTTTTAAPPPPTTAAPTTTTTTPPPAPPQAFADSATVNTGGFVNVRVVRNDVDPAAQGLTVVSVGATGAGGSVTDNGNGTLRYQPAGGFTGTDTFTYTVVDGLGRTATATVTVTVS